MPVSLHHWALASGTPRRSPFQFEVVMPSKPAESMSLSSTQSDGSIQRPEVPITLHARRRSPWIPGPLRAAVKLLGSKNIQVLYTDTAGTGYVNDGTRVSIVINFDSLSPLNQAMIARLRPMDSVVSQLALKEGTRAVQIMSAPEVSVEDFSEEVIGFARLFYAQDRDWAHPPAPQPIRRRDYLRWLRADQTILKEPLTMHRHVALEELMNPYWRTRTLAALTLAKYFYGDVVNAHWALGASFRSFLDFRGTGILASEFQLFGELAYSIDEIIRKFKSTVWSSAAVRNYRYADPMDLVQRAASHVVVLQILALELHQLIQQEKFLRFVRRYENKDGVLWSALFMDAIERVITANETIFNQLRFVLPGVMPLTSLVKNATPPGPMRSLGGGSDSIEKSFLDAAKLLEKELQSPVLTLMPSWRTNEDGWWGISITALYIDTASKTHQTMEFYLLRKKLSETVVEYMMFYTGEGVRYESKVINDPAQLNDLVHHMVEMAKEKTHFGDWVNEPKPDNFHGLHPEEVQMIRADLKERPRERDGSMSDFSPSNVVIKVDHNYVEPISRTQTSLTVRIISYARRIDIYERRETQEVLQIVHFIDRHDEDGNIAKETLLVEKGFWLRIKIEITPEDKESAVCKIEFIKTNQRLRAMLDKGKGVLQRVRGAITLKGISVHISHSVLEST
jgi:hypothetical protein